MRISRTFAFCLILILCVTALSQVGGDKRPTTPKTSPPKTTPKKTTAPPKRTASKRTTTTGRQSASQPTKPARTTSSARAGAVVRNGIGMELVYVPAGSFLMGSPASEAERGNDEGPQHQVTIREGFYMGRYEVTQAQWQAVMGSNPSNFKGCDQCPVEQVSWNDAQEFIRKLNARGDGYTYRLPTEAEWEYACRAGTTTEFAYGNSLSSEQANFNGNHPYGGAAKGVYRQKTTPVGSFQPNAFGLYDMHGNVSEWCEDWSHESYNGAPVDGSAWLSGGEQTYRALRGGWWSSSAGELRSALRYWDLPVLRYSIIGFRLVAVARS